MVMYFRFNYISHGTPVGLKVSLESRLSIPNLSTRIDSQGLIKAIESKFATIRYHASGYNIAKCIRQPEKN